MTTYRVYGIQWETDGKHIADLPKEVMVDIEGAGQEDNDLQQAIGQVSDLHGWLIAECNIERVG